MVKDQLFYTLPTEVQMFVKEKGKQKLDEVVSNATNYIEAHGIEMQAGGTSGKAKDKKGDSDKKGEANEKGRFDDNPKNKYDTGSVGMMSGNGRQDGVGDQMNNSGIQCYGCGMVGHKVYSCPARHNDSRIQCYGCGMMGHKVNSCTARHNEMQRIAAVSIVPQSYGRSTAYRSRVINHKRSGSKQVEGDENCVEQTCQHDVDSEGTVGLECGCKIPVLAFVSTKHNRKCEDVLSEDVLNSDRGPIGKATVNNDEVTCLRDTGASLDLVRESLVKSDQLTGKTITCMLLDGTCRKYPVARVNVESEWYTGSIEAACVKDLIYALIIGNKRLGNSEMKHREIVDNDKSADIVPEEVEDVNEEVSGEKVGEKTENEWLLNDGESEKETEKDEIDSNS